MRGHNRELEVFTLVVAMNIILPTEPILAMAFNIIILFGLSGLTHQEGD